MRNQLTRRDWLTATAALGMAPALPAAEPSKRPANEPFGYCLNTSTIRAEKLTIADKIDIAAKAGYHAIEPWLNEIEQHIKDGGTLKDLAKQISSNGLTVESAIAFDEWIVDDEARRKKGLEGLQRHMEMVREIGGKRIAAPPVGATNQADLDLRKAAERYRAILELGDKTGVVPQVELWGSSKSLNRLGDVLFVAVESGHPQACVLLDVYHLYKGGSGYGGLKMIGGSALHVIHANDYPANPPRAEITDAQRIFPGDGVAPWKAILRDLKAIGFTGMLSLELFNRDYWKQDAAVVARLGLEKMRALVRATFA